MSILAEIVPAARASHDAHASYCSDRDAGDERNFGVAEAVAIAKQQRFALERRQPRDFGLDDRVVRQCIVVAPGVDGRRGGGDLVHQLPLAPLPPQIVHRPMPGGAKQPGPERARIRQAGEAAVHRQPDVLMDVVGGIANEAAEIAQRLRAKPFEERRKRPVVTGLAPHDHESKPKVVRDLRRRFSHPAYRRRDC